MAKDTQERKQRIINAAREEIRESSVEKASLRSIAQRAGITTGSIYHHYKNKEELLFDVVNDAVHFSTRVSEMDKSAYGNPGEILDLIMNEVTIRLGKKDEQLVHIQLLSDAISKGGEIKEMHAKNYDEIIDRTADMFYDAYGIENIAYKRGAAAFLIAALDGMAVQSALGILPDDVQRIADRFNDFFGHAIGRYLCDHMPSEE